jgi:hypothetical protein
MVLDGDQLAGIVDLFGGLDRAELFSAIEELRFRQDENYDEAAIGDAIEAAVDAYQLVRLHRADDTLLVPGPTAFPDAPSGSEDLPHILDVPRRSVDRAAVAAAAMDRLERDTDSAVREGDADRARELLDVTYDIEAYGDVDASDVRERLDGVA